MSKSYYEQLEVFRAIAALSICSLHFDFNTTIHHYFGNEIFVQLFFTLSGFVIFLNYFEKINNKNDIISFFKKRFKRLYPLHLFFLLVFLFVEVAKYIFYLKYGIEANNKAFSENNIQNFFLNIFFLQHLAETHSFNSPSWSISVEMMLYITSGIIFLYFKKSISWICAIYIFVFLIFFNNLYGANLSMDAYFSGLYSFFIGCLFCFLFIKTKKIIKNIYYEIFYLFFLIIFFVEFFYLKFINNEYLYSIFFGLIFFLSCFLKKNSIIYKALFNSFFIYLGKISYSIYLSHIFVIWTIKQFLRFVMDVPTIINNNIIYLDMKNLDENLITIFAFLITIIFSSFTYKFIELKFYKKK